MDRRIISKGFKFFAWVLFILYLPVLIYVIVLKGGSSIAVVSRYRTEIPFMQRIASSNFIPFKTIFYYLGGNQNFIVFVENILGNILAFSPLGFLLPILFNRYKRLKNIFFISVAVSLSIEIVQIYFNIGSCDIDDLILNVLGSILGFGVYKVLKHMRGKGLEVTSEYSYKVH